MYTTFKISISILYNSGRKVSIFFRHWQINLYIYLKMAEKYVCVCISKKAFNKLVIEKSLS